MASGLRRAAVRFKSSFSLQLGTSRFSHGHMLTLLPWLLHSNIYAHAFWLNGRIHCRPRADTLPGTAPSHTQTEKSLCKHKHIMNPMQNRHQCISTHIELTYIHMNGHMKVHTSGQKSAVLSVRLDAFSNSPAHKCIIWLF